MQNGGWRLDFFGGKWNKQSGCTKELRTTGMWLKCLAVLVRYNFSFISTSFPTACDICRKISVITGPTNNCYREQFSPLLYVNKQYGARTRTRAHTCTHITHITHITHTHIHTHTHTHTRTHARTHTHMCSRRIAYPRVLSFFLFAFLFHRPPPGLPCRRRGETRGGGAPEGPGEGRRVGETAAGERGRFARAMFEQPWGYRGC